MAAFVFLLHCFVSAVTEYGIFRDELYYIACSKRLAWGYVDQPPFSIGLLAFNRLLFGDSLVALRLLPSLVMSAVIVMTAILTIRLGGKRKARMTAALAAVISPLYIGSGNYFSMNVFDIFFWVLLFVLFVEMFESGNPRWWLVIGATAGLGMMNKYSVGFMLFGLVAGILCTPSRKILFSRWFVAGATIGGIIFLPHIVWEIRTGWPTLEFIRNAQLYKNADMNLWQFFVSQIIEMNPVNVVVWGAGLMWLLVSRRGKTVPHTQSCSPPEGSYWKTCTSFIRGAGCIPHS